MSRVLPIIRRYLLPDRKVSDFLHIVEEVLLLITVTGKLIEETMDIVDTVFLRISGVSLVEEFTLTDLFMFLFEYKLLEDLEVTLDTTIGSPVVDSITFTDIISILGISIVQAIDMAETLLIQMFFQEEIVVTMDTLIGHFIPESITFTDIIKTIGLFIVQAVTLTEQLRITLNLVEDVLVVLTNMIFGHTVATTLTLTEAIKKWGLNVATAVGLDDNDVLVTFKAPEDLAVSSTFQLGYQKLASTAQLNAVIDFIGYIIRTSITLTDGVRFTVKTTESLVVTIALLAAFKTTGSASVAFAPLFKKSGFFARLAITLTDTAVKITTKVPEALAVVINVLASWNVEVTASTTISSAFKKWGWNKRQSVTLTDIAEYNYHSNVAHADSGHTDHQDNYDWTNLPHDNTVYNDIPHVNWTQHSDDLHENWSNYDATAHSDSHLDWAQHSNVAHVDNLHVDWNQYADNLSDPGPGHQDWTNHSNVVHGDSHTDWSQHSNTAHSDIPHLDWSQHSDVVHGDWTQYSDTATYDDHANWTDYNQYTDWVAHSDNHQDITHQDWSQHSDV